MKISNSLIKADQVCGFIPVISTISNLINLIIKCALNRFQARGGIIENEYLNHLNKKTVSACLISAIPFAGLTIAAIAIIVSGISTLVLGIGVVYALANR